MTKSTIQVGYFIMSDASGRVFGRFYVETLSWAGVTEADILIDGFGFEKKFNELFSLDTNGRSIVVADNDAGVAAN